MLPGVVIEALLLPPGQVTVKMNSVAGGAGGATAPQPAHGAFSVLEAVFKHDDVITKTRGLLAITGLNKEHDGVPPIVAKVPPAAGHCATAVQPTGLLVSVKPDLSKEGGYVCTEKVI